MPVASPVRAGPGYPAKLRSAAAPPRLDAPPGSRGVDRCAPTT